jgi:envelope integrity protein B
VPVKQARRIRAGLGSVMRLLCLCPLAALLIVTQSGPAAAVDLQAHHAVYRMVLSRATRSSDVVSADGVMVYRFARGCDGWTVENQTLLRLLYDNDTQADTLWSFASWESADGTQFRFHARYDQDGKNIERLEGQADLQALGEAGTARFSQPPDKVIPLPRGTLFPTEHVRQVIAAAQSGNHLFNRTVFDGASLDNPYAVNAALGPLSESIAEDLAKRLGLPTQPAWWTRMAFFPIGADAEVPEFEMSAQYRADGIADKIIQYFETFALDVQIKEIELLPASDC